MCLPLTLDDRHNSALLNSRRALETVGIDTLTLVSLERPHAQHFRLGRLAPGFFSVHTSKQLGLQAHLIERIDGLIVVGLDLACTDTWRLAVFCFVEGDRSGR